MDTDELQRRVQLFVSNREWQRFHNAKNLTAALASEVGELSAILRWSSTEEAIRLENDEVARRKLFDELGDIGILLLSFCNRLGVRFADVVGEKLVANEINYPEATSRGVAERPKSESL